MATYEIPLTPEAQIFSIDLVGITYQLTVLWCQATNTWILDVATEAGIPILTSLPLVANTDLFAPYAYLNLGGQLIAQTDDDLNSPPTYDNLGITGHLYFITP